MSKVFEAESALELEKAGWHWNAACFMWEWPEPTVSVGGCNHQWVGSGCPGGKVWCSVCDVNWSLEVHGEHKLNY